MKSKAFILLLCTALYLVEYAAVPHIMASTCNAPATTAIHHLCCQQAVQCCPKTNSHQKGNASPNCCLNCPLCYVTTLTETATPPGEVMTPQEYPVFVSSYIYTYHASCWKPPNATLA